MTDGHSGVGQLPRAGAVPLAGEPVTGLVRRGEFLTSRLLPRVVAVLLAQSCSTLRPHGSEEIGSSIQVDFPGRNTGGGSHFFSRGLSNPWIEPEFPASLALAGDSLHMSHTST